MNSTDPRAVKTRRALLEAFMQISYSKDFEQIKIKDITDAAEVNRATFYTHFLDKYHLMDEAVTLFLIDEVRSKWQQHASLTVESMTDIFMTLAHFQQQSNQQLRLKPVRTYELIQSHMERKLKAELQSILVQLLAQQQPEMEQERQHIIATMLSWSLYGASLEWQNQQKLSATAYIEQALPFLIDGLLYHRAE
ncbi:TetR/AcrR family transcriptional regulator [Paenibacillus sp. WLX2291]|uniref:TetR/AcrR family transcriptional regulator n=1 Tax=Paenibacillus sp. WLX2291 TaxID=3296934 RepID=UPI0039844CA5